MTRLTLDSPIRDIDPKISIRRLGTKAGAPGAHQVLAEMDIHTVRQLLHHYPRDHIDRERATKIRDLHVGQSVTLVARVKKVESRLSFARRGQKPKPIVTVKLYDGTGYIKVVYFNQPWKVKQFKLEEEVSASGIVEMRGGGFQLKQPEVESLVDEDQAIHTRRLIPIYRAAEGIAPRTIRELVFVALQRLTEIPDPVPADVVADEGLDSHDLALRRMHFPSSQEELDAARERLKFDELFMLELGVAFRKHRVTASEAGVVHDADTVLLKRFVEGLPFELTAGQRRAIAEIGTAMQGTHPMNVLLQGDVGSGKTAVAFAAAMTAIGSGHQAAIMAPTEVLAAQHERKVAELLGPLGARRFLDAAPRADAQPSLLEGPADEPAFTYALLTAATTGKNRERVLAGVRDGTVDLVVGTHALVQEGVAFSDLSLAVIDEQHRFGVHQRMALKGKGAAPDVLIMTATPIPRTLALTYYGDLDVTVLDELPAGRQPIRTQVITTELERSRAYEVVRQEVAAGRQAFVVCAAIDEGNKLEVKAAESEAARLQDEVFRELVVEVLHGRMRTADKDARMEDFRTGRCNVLISTTVIEVGVDVPNATVMLVENAERFGLAQLHQLRGRIGRGGYPSHCFLFDESRGEGEARERLRALAETTDGFELANADLDIRGEGTLFNVKQSGMPELQLARLPADVDLVQRSRARAFAVIEGDPKLDAHPTLLRELEQRFAESIDWLFHS
ncbi:MAG: ATP-dependent DNA helicase RecG [Actinomycetota bacterium]